MKTARHIFIYIAILIIGCYTSQAHAWTLFKLQSVNASFAKWTGKTGQMVCIDGIGSDYALSNYLSTYIAHNFKYPHELIGDSISAHCDVTFDVDNTGRVSEITHIKVSKNIDCLKAEAERVITTLVFPSLPKIYDDKKEMYLPETKGLTIGFDIVPYPAEKIENKDELLEIMSSYGWYCATSSNGWGGRRAGWVLQENLKAQTSTQEKVEIFKTSKNPVVRFTAFNGLVEEHYPECVSLAKSCIDDSSSMGRWWGDLLLSSTLPDAVISELFSHKDIYTVADSLAIDSLVFYSPMTGAHKYRDKLLLRLAPTPERYSRVKELCYQEHSGSALHILVQYRKEEDKPLFIKALKEYSKGLDKRGACTEDPEDTEGRTNDALEAIISWPDKDFIPALVKLGDYELRRQFYDYQRIELFYRAIMEYDNEWAYGYIKELFTNKGANKNGYHRQYLYRAYYKNPHPHERFLNLVKKYAEKPWDWDINRK